MSDRFIKWFLRAGNGFFILVGLALALHLLTKDITFPQGPSTPETYNETH